MTRALAFVVAAFSLAGAADVQQTASRPADGTVLSEAPCEFTPYDQASPFTQRYYSREDYSSASASTAVDCLRIRYSSNGLSVVGFVVKPRKARQTRHPVIVYNRGGFRDIGKLESWNLVDFHGFASQGFVVLASQYRGSDGGDGKDEVGGADLNDVMALSRLAARLPYADSGNLFLYGLSRGGMMSFLALRRGFPARAVAVVGALFDVEAMARRSPQVAEAAMRDNPDYATQGVALLRDRSVTNWPEKIGVPVLIIHGEKDQEVPFTDAEAFAAKLKQLGKRYDLVVYPGDVHQAATHRRDRDARILAWFRQFTRR